MGGGMVRLLIFLGGGVMQKRERESLQILDFQRLASLQNCELTKQNGLVS